MSPPPDLGHAVVMWLVAALIAVGLGILIRARRPRSRQSRWGSWGRHPRRGRSRGGPRGKGGQGPEGRPQRKPLGAEALQGVHRYLDGVLDSRRSARETGKRVAKKTRGNP